METLIPFLGYVVAGTVTPGPNNLMVLASGANWGLRRTMPHILGISLGFPAMIVAVGVGLDALFDAYPLIRDVLKWVSFAYLLWLAWRIANAGNPKSAEPGTRQARPMSFLEAAAFQWVNPKAWAMVIGGIALFTTTNSNPVVQVGAMALLFGLVCVPNCVTWCVFGTAIARYLANDRHRMVFNIAMAALLVLSVVPTVFELH
jgi:threonine/homoserine/homoserine lactone efflux protein